MATKTKQQEIRIDIGLEGGQGLEITADESEWDRLTASLAKGGEDWATVVDRTGAEYRIAAHKVGFVCKQTVDRPIGFRKP